MRYCSGSGFELLSDSDVMAVCQDSKVFLIRQLLLKPLPEQYRILIHKT